MPIAHVNGIDIHYQIKGLGARLLYIGGTGGDLRARPNILDSPLAGSFTVCAYDQRGLGRTSIPGGPYTMAAYADDAAGLLAHLGWQSASVAGFSFGGMVAQELALSAPERMKRLVLISTSPSGGGPSSSRFYEALALPLEVRAERMARLADQRRGGEWRKKQPEEWRRLYHEKLAMVNVGAGEPGRERGLRSQLQARRGHDTWDRLDRINAPTLVCAGRYDGIARPEEVRAMAQRIPEARLEWFEGGHFFFRQDAQSFVRINAFLATGGDPA